MQQTRNPQHTLTILTISYSYSLSLSLSLSLRVCVCVCVRARATRKAHQRARKRYSAAWRAALGQRRPRRAQILHAPAPADPAPIRPRPCRAPSPPLLQAILALRRASLLRLLATVHPPVKTGGTERGRERGRERGKERGKERMRSPGREDV